MGDPIGIIDAGRWSGSDNNLGRVLQTVRRERRAEPDLRVHARGALRGRAVDEPSFIDAFQRIDVPEPHDGDARSRSSAAAAQPARERRARAHGRARGAAAAFELGRRFEPYRALPGQGGAAARGAIQQVSAGGRAPRRASSREDVIAAFAAAAGCR